MEIRPLEAWEIDSVYEVYCQNHRTDKKNIKLDLQIACARGSKTRYFVADDGGEIQGFAGFRPTEINHRIYQLFDLNISQPPQIRGVRKKLIDFVVEKIVEERGKIVLISTHDPRFYDEEFNFKPVTIFDNGTTYLMLLNLEN